MWRDYLKLPRTFFPASVAGDQLNFLSHIFLRWSLSDNDLLWWYASAVKFPSRYASVVKVPSRYPIVQPNSVKYLNKFLFPLPKRIGKIHEISLAAIHRDII